MVAENALFDVNYLCRPVATPIAQPSDHRGSRGSGFFARVVDIGEDIDFIHITEDVGIIGGRQWLQPRLLQYPVNTSAGTS